MKKIKSLKQLRAEKERINQHLEHLEIKMRDDWNKLKSNLKPASLIKDSFSSLMKKRSETNFAGESLLKGTLVLGVSLLANRLFKKAGKKFTGLFKKKKIQPRDDDPA